MYRLTTAVQPKWAQRCSTTFRFQPRLSFLWLGKAASKNWKAQESLDADLCDGELNQYLYNCICSALKRKINTASSGHKWGSNHHSFMCVTLQCYWASSSCAPSVSVSSAVTGSLLQRLPCSASFHYGWGWSVLWFLCMGSYSVPLTSVHYLLGKEALVCQD